MSSDSSDTRSKILDAARRLLEDRQVQGVRMSDIARAAGVSRQAVYLHFNNRADLLIALTRHVDAALGLEDRLAPSRAAASGTERLDAYIRFWGEYLPGIAGIARALLAMRATDAEAAKAWADRMAAMREGCTAAIEMLSAEGRLHHRWDVDSARDMLWAMLSFETWDTLTRDCGWSGEDYIARMQLAARRSFVNDSGPVAPQGTSTAAP